MNKAVHYLGRYTASRQRLREVLKRFALRKLESHEQAEIDRALESVIEDCVRLGYVDDTAFALSRARGKRRAGRSDPQTVDEALQAADEDLADGELAAALRHAARRRIGPYTLRVVDEAGRNRHLASFARAGFSLAVARQVMALEDAAAAEELAEELRR